MMIVLKLYQAQDTVAYRRAVLMNDEVQYHFVHLGI